MQVSAGEISDCRLLVMSYNGTMAMYQDLIGCILFKKFSVFPFLSNISCNGPVLHSVYCIFRSYRIHNGIFTYSTT